LPWLLLLGTRQLPERLCTTAYDCLFMMRKYFGAFASGCINTNTDGTIVFGVEEIKTSTGSVAGADSFLTARVCGFVLEEAEERVRDSVIDWMAVQ
jgi:hypothetical protein